MGGENAADKEREMREHEAEARRRDSDERSGGGGGDGMMGNALGEDEEGGTPAPPGNVPAGGQSG